MLGRRISELRNEQGLTQQTVAEGIGVSRATYAHYEIDRREPDNATLIKIANFFHVSTDYLLGLTDLRKPYVLAVNDPLYDRVLEDVKTDGLTPGDMQEVHPALSGFMQENDIIKAKAKLDLIETSGLTLETLEKLVLLINQIKKETTEA